MKVCKKLMVVLALLLVTGSSAFALGLGQIKVKSTLNQPLVAEIPVVSATPDELRNLKVSLASSEDFQRAGINRARLETPLKFTLEKRNGSTVIVITSEEPVSDPALDMLLELNWSSGKLLREYSVLLDPPGMPAAYTDRPVATTAAAKESKPVQTTSAAPKAKNSKASAPASRAVSSSSSSTTPTLKMGDSYTARSGDNAWSIARRSTVDSGDINRMMVALQRANPDAFYKDNINALKKGAVLRIPERAEIAKISASDARSDVRQQNQVWSNPGAASPSMMASNNQAPAAPVRAPRASADNRLELVPPGGKNSSGSGRTGVAGGSGQAAVAGLKQELSRAKEMLASEKQRSDDMSARVKDLEGIRDKNQRLLELKNAQIAQLQDKLAKTNEAGGAAASKPLREDIFEPGEGDSTAATSEPVAAASVASLAAAGSAALASAGDAPANAGTSESAAQAAVATSAAIAEAAVASTVASAVVTASPEQEKVQPVATEAPTAVVKPWYMQMWAWILGGLIILGLILFSFLGRRGKSANSRQDLLSDTLATAPADGEEGLIDDSEDEYALLEEIEQHPDELSLHLELASLYYAHRDQDKFEGTAEAMYAHVDDPAQPEWQQVRAMGEELCPDHPLFAELHSDGQVVAGSDSELAAIASEFDTDDDTVARSASGDDGRGYNFDFDLTPAGAGARHSDDEDAALDDEYDGSTAAEDEDLLSLSTLEPSTSSDDLDTSPLAEEFDIDQVRADSDSEQSEVVAEKADTHDVDLAADDAGTVSAEEEFSSDPVDTKLDLARAYQDMGDEEGARAMLEEVLQEGSEAQKGVAHKLLDDLS